ncbi:MAG: hypothetical protein Q6364_05995 [Candidatus Hermodarchaeota archaeon]|nr:hypothetical protein [Candidatus Hermodarchaeota archaeon]
MNEPAPEKSSLQAFVDVLILGIAGVFILWALSFAIFGGVRPGGPDLSIIAYIAMSGFLGFFLLGISLHRRQ